MCPTDATTFPEPPEAARLALAATREAAAAGDWETVGHLAPPLLGHPALHAEALLLLLDAARMTGDTDAALQYAGRAARIAPESPRARGLFAMAQNEAGRPGEALATALAARTADPDDAIVNSAVCLAALRLGRPRAAVAAARALAAAPRRPDDAAALARAVLTAAGAQSDLATGEDTAGPSRDAVPAAPETAPVPIGMVRCDTSGRIDGYLAAPACDRVFSVVLADDAGRRMTVAAGDFDPDLLSRGLGDGRHAFAVAWPHAGDASCVRVTATCAETGEALDGSPVPVPFPPLAAGAVAHLAAWLRRAAASPDAPPPLPDACRGPVLDLARQHLAALAAALDAQPREPEKTAGDADA